MDNSRRTPVDHGRRAEEIAAQWLVMEGMEILDRNRRAADGEIDIIAREGFTLVFVEVRARRAGAWVGGAGSIDRRKWGRLRRCARELAREDSFRWAGRRMRLDAVLLELAPGSLRLRHLRNLPGPASGR